MMWLLPCSLTLAAGACGGVAIALVAADARRIPLAIGLILAAALLDAIDGPIARALDAATRLGAWLDRVADFVSFGVAPMTIVLSAQTRIGDVPAALPTAACAAYLLACATRLLQPGRRNDHHFVGVPAPLAALVVLAPVVASASHDTCGVVTAVAAALMLVPIHLPTWLGIRRAMR